MNELSINCDQNEVNILCLLDMSAAFDTVDHTILVQRLSREFGIRGTVLDWFESYLSERCQTVVVGGVRSADMPLDFGVPQGSVLGPVLFTLYMKDLGNIIRQYDLNFHCYADDTQLYKSTQWDKVDTLVERLQLCFSDIKAWMNENKIKLNDAKTEVILIGRPDVVKKVTHDSVVFGNDVIKISNTVKNLGVFIDSDLSFKSHVNSTIR